jgi:phage tail sheath protein FI
MTYGRPGVYVSETLLPAPITAVGGANAAGAAVGVFAQGPTTLTLVNSWYEFTKQFGGYNAKFPATIGVAQFFNNGGTELYVQRILSSDATAAQVTLPTTTTGSIATITAVNLGADGNNLRVQVTTGAIINTVQTYNVSVYKEVVSQYLGTNDASGSNDALVEFYSNLVFSDVTASNFAQTVINNTSTHVVVSNVDIAAIPATQALSAVLPLTGGNNGSDVTSTDFSDALATDGTSPFDVVERPLVIFAPEVYTHFYITSLGNGDSDATAATAGQTAASAIHNSLAGWANSGLGYAVIDVIPSQTTGDAINYAAAITNSTSQAAVYYPNYFIADPLSGSTNALRKVGPASAVAGLYIATDKRVGPFKSPAGTTATLRGALSLERSFTSGDLDTLNSAGTPVNAIRNIPGAGIVVMGGRTLLQDGSANKYVNMRRSLIYIKKRMQDLTQFAVFQNNDYRLWAQLRNTLTVFLNEYRNQGGLRGATTAQSFYVKVDAENNTPTSIALGEVHIEVGVALEYPAEFVVINLSQTTGI